MSFLLGEDWLGMEIFFQELQKEEKPAGQAP